MKAVVVFHGEVASVEEGITGIPTHPLNRYLREGFKHCFVCVESDGLWIQLDGKNGIPQVRYLTASDRFDLAGFYREQNFTVIETEQRNRPLLSPFVTNNCVGLVKAVLCISAPFIWSPWRLYQHLLRKSP